MFTPARLACIFASQLPIQVEQQRRSDNAPILIPHPIGGETVYAVSSELHLLGVQVGMTLHEAKQIAPDAIIAGPDEYEYHRRHEAIRSAIMAYSTAIETTGLGEFLINIRGLEKIHGGEEQLANELLEAANEASGLAIRVGIGSGKFIAQQAVLQTQNNTVLVVDEGDEPTFVAPLPITVLPGLNGNLYQWMKRLDIHTLGNLTAFHKAAILRQFGGEASTYYELARGRDPRHLQTDLPPLRIIRARSFTDHLLDDRQMIANAVNDLSKHLSSVLNAQGYHAEALKLKIMLGRRHHLALEDGRAFRPPTADPGKIGRLAMQLLDGLGAAEEVAHISLCAYPLRSRELDYHQQALTAAGVSEKRIRLEDAIQLLIHRFGEAIIKIAALLGPPIPLSVQVKTGKSGWPTSYSIAGSEHPIIAIHQFWREEKGYLGFPISRECYQVMLGDESLRNLFRNMITGVWYLDRAWPLL